VKATTSFLIILLESKEISVAGILSSLAVNKQFYINSLAKKSFLM
jgi:hypothetical protein